MRIVNVLTSVSSLALYASLTTIAIAQPMHVKTMAEYESGRHAHKIGWDQRNLEAQTEGAIYLRSQIEELKKQNEHLRNSLSKLSRKQKSNTNTVAPDLRIQALIEENKRLTGIIKNTQNNPQKTIDNSAIYLNKIENLENENQNLTRSLSQLQALNKNENSQEINALKNSVKSLEEDNRNMARALADATGKALKYQKQAQSVQLNRNTQTNEVTMLSEKLKSAQIELQTLRNQVQTQKSSKANISAELQKDMEVLKKQNTSLRETIKAQNELLVSSTNASETAERLMSENAMLKRKLEETGRSSQFNGETAKQLFEKNKKLYEGIAKRDDHIQQLNGLKETVKQLRAQNDAYLAQIQKSSSAISSASVVKRDSNLDEVNASLQSALEQEREATIQYRKQIEEYKNQISLLVSNTRIEENVLSPDIEELKRENNQLKAQIKRLSNSATYRVPKESRGNTQENSAVFAKKDQLKSGVTYVESDYPAVTDVLPLLDENGERINYGNLSRAENDVQTKTEELLSKQPTPLQ